MLIQSCISNVLDNGCSLFLINKCSCLDNELFRIIFKLIKNSLFDTTQNSNNILTSQLCLFHQFANQIVFHTTIDRNPCLRTVSRSFLCKSCSTFQSFFRFNFFHCTWFNLKENLSNSQLSIQRCYCISDQFINIKIYDINRLCINLWPERLKLRHSKFFFINPKLNIITTSIFRLHCPRVVNRVDEFYNGCCEIIHFFSNLQNAIGFVFVVFISQYTLLVDIAVNSQIIHDGIGSIPINHLFTTIRIVDDLSYKQISCNSTRPICHSLCDFTL